MENAMHTCGFADASRLSVLHTYYLLLVILRLNANIGKNFGVLSICWLLLTL